MSFLCRCSHSYATRFFLGLVLCSLLFPYFYCYFFLAKKKKDVHFPNAVERNFHFFNLSSAVQYVLLLEFSLREFSCPYFLREPRTYE